MIKTTTATLIVLLCAGRAWAVDASAGSSGGSFLKIGQGSARAMALGRSYVALAEGSDAMTWNPAGLGVTQQKEVAYSFLRYVEDVSSPLYMAYAHPMGRTVFGANLSYMTVSGLDVRDDLGRPKDSDTAQVRNGSGAVGIARSFWYEKLFLGVSARLIHEDNAGSVHDTLAGDIGAIFKPNNTVSLGFSSQNIGAGKANASQVTRGGVGVKWGDFLTTSVELNKESDNAPRVGLGAEFQLPEEYLEFGQLAFRVGYFNADNLGQNYSSTLKGFQLDRSNGFSFGFGMYTSRAFGYGLSIDYAVVPSGALGTVDQMSVKLKF